MRPSTENYNDNSETNHDRSAHQNADGKKHNRTHNNQNRNRNNNKNPKPKAQPPPEFQHLILDKIVVTKSSVQDRLLRSQMMDDKDQTESKNDSETTVAPTVTEDN